MDSKAILVIVTAFWHGLMPLSLGENDPVKKDKIQLPKIISATASFDDSVPPVLILGARISDGHLILKWKGSKLIEPRIFAQVLRCDEEGNIEKQIQPVCEKELKLTQLNSRGWVGNDRGFTVTCSKSGDLRGKEPFCVRLAHKIPNKKKEGVLEGKAILLKLE